MNLREYRQRRGLSQVMAAYLAGVDQGNLSKIERGLVRPRRATVVKLATGYGLGLEAMFRLLDASANRGIPDDAA